MGANDRKISVTLNIDAEITKYREAMSKIQENLSKLHLPEGLANDAKNIFNLYADEVKHLEKLIEDEGGHLTPVNEKKVKDSVNDIEKIYKNLIKKLNSKGFQASVLEQDYKALKQMQEAQVKYEKAVKDTKNQIEQQENAINKAKESLEKQRRIAEQSKNVENQRKQSAEEFRKSTSKEVAELKKQQEALKNTHKEEEAQQKYRSEHKDTLRGWTQSKARTQAIEEDRKAQEELAKVESRLQEIDKEQIRLDNEAAAAIKDAEKAQESFAKKQVETAASISMAQEKLADLRKELDTLSKDALKEIQQQLTESGIKWSDYEIDPDTLNSYDELQKALTKIIEAGGPNAKKTMDLLADASHQAGNAMRDMGEKVDGAGYSLDNLSDRQKEIDRMSQSIVQFFSIGNAVQLFKRAVRSAVATIQDLDKVMTETAVVTDFSVADMWKQLPEYTARANKLGVTIHDVYESATLYYQQGLKTNEVMAVSNATLKMARIASLDAAEATDRMTNALRGFNMEITETNADRVADVYSKLAAISASNVDEISTAMTKTASLASNANMKFETTAAFLAQIIETTRESAETAGTALKTVIARFSEVKELFSRGELLGIDEEGEAIDVNKVSKALRTAGINLNEYLTGAKGLDDIFMELASKWDSLDQVQQRYIATMAAGSRQQSRFIAMMQDYKRTTELVSAANNAAGASNEQYEKTLDSLESKINKLKNSWNTFLMDTTNSSAVKIAVDSLTGLINVINKISEVLPGFTSSILKMWAAFNIGRGMKALFGKNGDGIRPFMDFISDPESNGLLSFPTILGKITGKFGNFTKTVIENGISIKGLKKTFEGVQNPITGFIKGIDAVKASAAGSIAAVVGLAAAIFIIVQAVKAYKAASPKGQLQATKKEFSEATEVANDLNNAYEDLRNNFESLDDAVDTFNSLKKGTKEWNENLLKVDKQVLDLIEKYPKLASEVQYTEEGLRFKDADSILSEYRQQSARASLSVLNTQSKVKQASTRVERSELDRNLRNIKNLDEIAKSYASGMLDLRDSMSELGIELENKELIALRNYGNTLIETESTTRTLNQAFIDTLKTLNDWNEKEQRTADLIDPAKLEEYAQKRAKSESTDEYNAAVGGGTGIKSDVILKYYQENIDPYAQLNFLKNKIIDSQGNSIDIRTAQARYEREMTAQYQEEIIEKLVPLMAKLPQEVQQLLLNPTTLAGGKSFNGEEIQSQIELIEGLGELLKLFGIDIDKQIELYNKQSEQRRDEESVRKITDSSNLTKEFLNQISDEAFKTLLKNVDKYGNIFDLIFGLENDPQKFSDLVQQIFNEGIDLGDVESDEKLKNKIQVLDDSLSSDQIDNFINSLINLVGAVIKVDSDKFANMEAFVEKISGATTFGQDEYNELTKTYGFTKNDFTPVGGDSYQLSIPQEAFKAQLEKIIEDLRIKYDTKGAGDSEDIAAYQRTAGYYASNQVGSKTGNYYEGARSSFMNSEAWENYNTQLGENNLAAKAVTEKNEELANALYSSANAASKMLPKFKELTEVIKDNAEALQKDDLKAIAEVTKAFNKAFGTDLSEDFIQRNKPLLIDFANGVGDAYDKISDKVLQTFIDKDGVEQELKDLYTGIQGLDWDINGQMTLDGTPYFKMLESILNAGGETAKQLEENLKAAGITIEWQPTEYEEVEIGWNEKGPIYEKLPRRHIATLTNALGQQQTVNAKSGGGKSSGGGGSSKPKYWDNPYDELYNLVEKQNEALRVRERLERDYDRILKNRDKTAKELLQNSLNEISNLRKEIQIQEQIQAGRRRMISQLGGQGYRNSEGTKMSFDQWGVTRYASYDYNTNTITIDWAGIDRINDPDKGGAVEAYISKLEELTQSFEETQDQIEEMKDIIQEIKERNMQEYLDFEQRAYDAVIARQQKMIDDYSALSDTISESNNRIVDSLRESIDMERQIRDNTKTEEDIADKEARLEYLRRDTSGANQTEILKLEEELRNSRESYGDTLVDQAIDQLQKDNDLAAEQRSQQIEIMQAQLDWQDKTGYYWEEVYKLIDGAFDENGKVIEDSPLFNLLRQTEDYQRLSKYGKENFNTEGNEQAKQAYEGLYNWEHQNDPEPAPEPVTETSTAAAPPDPAHGNIASAGQLTPINSRRYSAAVERFQQGINDLINAGQLSINPIGVDGYYGNETFRAVKALQSAIGVRADGYWGPNSVAAFNSSSLKRYAKGGLVNSTGLAWLDGTKSAPEMVLSARDTENFIALRNALAQMLAQGIGGKGGDNYFDIQISVDELGSDYDVDQLADRIKKQIYDDSSYRNVNAISYLR